MHRTAAGWVEFGREGISNSAEIFDRYRPTPLDRAFPFRRMSADIMSRMQGAPVRHRWAAMSRLAYLNFAGTIAQILVRRRRRFLGLAAS